MILIQPNICKSLSKTNCPSVCLMSTLCHDNGLFSDYLPDWAMNQGFKYSLILSLSLYIILRCLSSPRPISDRRKFALRDQTVWPDLSLQQKIKHFQTTPSGIPPARFRPPDHHHHHHSPTLK